MWLTRVSIHNPYFCAVLMMALVVMGLFGLKKLPVEAQPDVRFPVAYISVDYPGASPEVVESEIAKPLEEALNTIDGIKEIRSYSMEGTAAVVAQFEMSVDNDQALQKVRDKVSQVQGRFRREISTPFITAIDATDNDALTIALTSKSVPLRELTSWTEKTLKKRLQMVAGVSQVSVDGGLKREIRVRLDPSRLEASGLSLPEIVAAMRAANQDFPAGSVTTASKEWTIRVAGKLKSVDDFAALAVGYRNGAPIRLDDVAEVADAEAESNSIALIDGQPGISVGIKAARGANEVEVVNAVKETMKELSKTMPAGVSYRYTWDEADQVKKSLATVESTLVEGVALTVLIVFLFLGSWRSTVITGLTLPVALIGTLFAIHLLGFTLNGLTLLALSLSIGLLIDDAIVVRENIVRHAAMGKSHFQAALEGTQEIGLAVLATTLTVVAVFLPTGFMEGIIGKFFHQFGITVAVAVLISMLVSFSLDPMLSSIWHDPHHHGDRHKGPLGRALDWFESSLDKLAERYVRVIRWVLGHRKTVLALATLLTVGSFGLATQVGGDFMPQMDEGHFSIKYETAPGSTLDYTALKGKELQQAVSGIKELKSVSLNAGGSGFGSGRNTGTLSLDVGAKNERKRSLEEVISDARKRVQPVAGVTIKSVGSEQNGKPIYIGLRGGDFSQLAIATEQVREHLKQVKGVRDIESNLGDGDPALSLSINRDAATSLGVDLDRLGNTLSVLLGGNAATQWEAPDGENYDVRLQVPKAERREELLDQIKVAGAPSADGTANMVPLSLLVHANSGSSPRQIKRTNMMREIAIQANVEGRDANSVFQDVDAMMEKMQLPPGVERVKRGQQKDMQESLLSAVTALGMGVMFIYMILAAQFRSFTLPISIMMALPLSFVGVFVSLFLWGSTLNIFSVIGIIMLMGLAAKNGILLIDFVNQARRQGMERTEALIEAGRVRLRPIMMTSLAMIFGMLPLALSNGEGSEGNRAMAHAIIGGLVTSTLLTLIVVPVVYTYLDGLRTRVRSLGRKGRSKKEEQLPPPALEKQG